MESTCVSCGKLTTKYKCPKCLERYCSSECCREHVKIGCQSKKARPNETEQDIEPTLFGPLHTEDTVPIEKLKQLEYSEGVRNLLYNPHLRNLLKEIDTAPSIWKAMEAAMHEPIFVEIADEFLKVVERSTNEQK